MFFYTGVLFIRYCSTLPKEHDTKALLQLQLYYLNIQVFVLTLRAGLGSVLLVRNMFAAGHLGFLVFSEIVLIIHNKKTSLNITQTFKH